VLIRIAKRHLQNVTTLLWEIQKAIYNNKLPLLFLAVKEKGSEHKTGFVFFTNQK